MKALLTPLVVLPPPADPNEDDAMDVRHRMLRYVTVGLVNTFDAVRGEPYGRTVLDLAAEWGNPEVFRYLLRYSQGFVYTTSGEASLLPAQVKPTALQVRSRTCVACLCRR